jgi:hypothetical protein
MPILENVVPPSLRKGGKKAQRRGERQRETERERDRERQRQLLRGERRKLAGLLRGAGLTQWMEGQFTFWNQRLPVTELHQLRPGFSWVCTKGIRAQAWLGTVFLSQPSMRASRYAPPT